MIRNINKLLIHFVNNVFYDLKTPALKLFINNGTLADPLYQNNP